MMEVVCGGELYKRLKKLKKYSEDDAAKLAFNLMSGLK